MFQSTRPRGARRVYAGHARLYGHVSIHAPAGGATSLTVIFFRSSGFNPRARGGRDARLHEPLYKRLCFNPRARGGRDFPERHSRAYYQFQSTRPRGARLRSYAEQETTCVSIHAPAGGATLAP